jgi:hypothetical protein
MEDEMATLLLQNHLQNSKKKKTKTKTKKNKGSSSPSWEVDEYEWDQVRCVGRMKHATVRVTAVVLIWFPPLFPSQNEISEK